MDDRITLLNGEKVLPLAIEGRIKQHHLVKEAVVFGIDREVPGLLLFRALGTEHLNDNEFLQEVWPLIDEANSRSEAFAQIGKDYVAIMAEDVDCPTTDKSSIKRGQIYRDFANIIDNVYHSISHHKAESLHLTLPQLQAWIMRCLAEMGHEIQDVNTDLFSAGIDSLKATQIRSRILRHIDLGGHESKCTPMLVYDTGTPAKLAYKLHQIRAGTQQLENEDELRLMEALIEENSSFGGRQSKEPKSPHSEQGIVVVCFLQYRQQRSLNSVDYRSANGYNDKNWTAHVLTIYRYSQGLLDRWVATF